MTKREMIINKTYELFADKGYTLSLSEVTAAAGLQKQSIYNYFKSKDDLIEAMLEQEISNYSNAIDAAVERIQNMPVLDRLSEMMLFSIDYFKDPSKLKIRRWLMMLQQQEPSAPMASTAKKLELGFYSIIKQDMAIAIEEKLIKSDSLELSVMFYIVFTRGIIDGLLVLNADSSYREELDRLINEYWRLVR